MEWEQVKWIIVFIAAGYAPMAGLIYFLIKKVIKAKDENIRIVREVLPFITKLENLLENQLAPMIKKMLDRLTNNISRG